MYSLFIVLSLGADDVSERNNVIASLKVAYDQWQQDVSFKARFRLRHGFANSVQAALSSGIDQNLNVQPERKLEASGFLCKKGRLMRLNLDFGHPALVVSEPAPPQKGKPSGPRVVRDVSFHEVTNGLLQVTYNPDPSSNYATVGKRTPSTRGIGPLAQTIFSPIEPFANPAFRPFELWDLKSVTDRVSVPAKVQSMDSDHVEVVLREKGSWTQMRRMRFRTRASIPVLSEIDEVATLPSGETIEYYVRLSDFRACPGGEVARKVLSASKPRAGPVFVREWISSDLGDAVCNDADFAVALASDTSVSGLKDPPRLGTAKRVIDITNLTEADLGDALPEYIQPLKPPKSVWHLAFVILIAILVPGLAIVILIRRHWRMRR